MPEALDALLAVWVELDLEEGGADLPGPSLFFEIAPSSGPELFDALLSSFAIESSPGERWEQALYLVETAPARARLSHVALMLGRPGAPVRFRICDLAPAGLGPYLARLGLEAAATALETSGLLLDPAPDSTAILLDAGSEGRVGVECFFEEGNSPGWKSFLDRLEKMALATGTEIEALRRWPGLQTRDRARTWPESFALGDALLVDRALSVFWRSVNHIKVDFDPAAEPAAKAYLAFGHRWVKCPDTGGLPAASGG